MTKDVLLAIRGLQFDADNDENKIDLDRSKNYKEALRAYEDLNKPNNLKIVPVATLDEAITYLLELNYEN